MKKGEEKILDKQWTQEDDKDKRREKEGLEEEE